MRPSLSPLGEADLGAKAIVAQLFSDHGWQVNRPPAIPPYEVDFLVEKGRQALAVEVKAYSEGRPDRVIPLLSHAILEAQSYCRRHGKARPLAIVHVGHASRSLINQIDAFARDYSNGVAIGVVLENGLRHFVGEGLENLNAEPQIVGGSHEKSPSLSRHLFSDLNQWMLKVLLAPEVPEQWLAAPRGMYRNASELAQAANVSQMSASRFIRQLEAEGYLDKSVRPLKLVRRADLIQRWQSSGLQVSPLEKPMVFMLGGPVENHLRQLKGNDACLALFAAADALKLGHVSGVPRYVYGPRWDRLDPNVWPVFPAAEKPDFILREAKAHQSVFRAIIRPEGVPVCDAIQVWLDVSRHPSRGAEQAELIYRKVLRPLIEGPGV